jgi:outer membrane protein OmpA-like peptidoglycan-associated protein
VGVGIVTPPTTGPIVDRKIVSSISTSTQQLIAKTSQWMLAAKVATTAGAVLPLAGSSLSARSGDLIEFSVVGLVGNSVFKVIAYSEPTLLATLRVNADGTLTAKVSIVSSLPAGRHTLQFESVNLDGSPLIVSFPLEVMPGMQLVKSPTLKSFFAGGSAKLSLAQKQTLAKAFKPLTAATKLTIQVHGFVKRSPVAKSDSALANARARAVVAYLKSLGITATFKAIAKGYASEDTASARRAETTFTYYK